jgi:L-ascorbate metabolism protein UlaG (beta-lactamase superfamily)
MIEPYLAGDALQAEIQQTDPGDGLVLWWLGQSGFLVKHRLGNVLLDPYLSDSLTEKYAQTDKPHVRMTRRAMSPSQLQNVTLVTSSHNHTDHLDAQTLQPLFQVNPGIRFVIPEANRQFVCQRVSVALDWPIGIDAGDTLDIHGIQIYAVPAAHNEIDRDAEGRCHYLGYVIQLGKFRIYHSGDTLRYPAMVQLLRPLNIDLALLPINGNHPERRVAGNMFGNEASQLAHECGFKLVVPCHYDMFQFNTESPDLFIQTCKSLSQDYRVLECGQRFHYC